MSGKLSEPQEEQPPEFGPWSPLVRRAVSLLLVGYLGLVVLGPLSNPVASRFLTGPLAVWAGPLMQGLYLNHGYRFFAPEPGPGHLVRYEITLPNGGAEEGHFPDRTRHWPRLLYHRWFMLSERIFEEFLFTPDESAFRERERELLATADQLRAAGQFVLADQVRSEAWEDAERYQIALERIDGLLRSLAAHLLAETGGIEITLTIQERALPGPLDLAAGIPLDDARYLQDLKTIARFRRMESGELESLPLPTPTLPDSPLPQIPGGGP